MFVIRTLTLSTIKSQQKLIFTVHTFKKQNSIDMEKYNGLSIDILYLVRQPQVNIIIIIITLFQEDNIFGTNVSLTYGPRLQR